MPRGRDAEGAPEARHRHEQVDAEVQSGQVAGRVPGARPQHELGDRRKSGVRGTARFLLPAATRRTVGPGRPIEAPLLERPRGPDRKVRPPNLEPAANSPSNSKRRPQTSSRGVSKRRRAGAQAVPSRIGDRRLQRRLRSVRGRRRRPHRRSLRRAGPPRTKLLPTGAGWETSGPAHRPAAAFVFLFLLSGAPSASALWPP